MKRSVENGNIDVALSNEAIYLLRKSLHRESTMPTYIETV